jgi:heme oxygenase
LRAETAAQHEALERLLDLTQLPISPARYRHVLQAFYGFYGPLEPLLSRVARSTVPALPFALRERTPLLARDLEALGMSRRDVAGLPQCEALPRVASPAQLGGCLYVLEGATLGGQFIVRALERRVDVELAAAAAFFAGDGARTGPRWKRVTGWLEQLARADASADALVCAARATFESLERWLRARGVGR